jgi:hypothetical protein
MLRKMLMVAALAAFFISIATAHAEENLFTLEQMVVAIGIEEREPVGVSNLFQADIERVYCFVEARNIQRPTTVRTVWYHHDEEIASVQLELGQGFRWRTFSSMRIRERTGAWRVDLLDEADRVMRSVDFEVE